VTLITAAARILIDISMCIHKNIPDVQESTAHASESTLGYKEGIRLRKSTMLHPTDFGQISLLQRIEGSLATARQQ